MAKYIGLTIGPIYKTLKTARKTRELWGASYIFSYMMKRMIMVITSKGREFVLPAVSKDLTESNNGAGLFHDRFIFKSEEGDFEELGMIRSALLEEIGKEIGDIDFAKKYFSIYFCEIECEGEYKDVNKKINSYLDTLELQQKFIESEDKASPLFYFFQNRIKGSFLFKDAFGSSNHSFPSLPEISAVELKHKEADVFGKISESGDDKDDLTDILTKVNKSNKRIYHKYIAIVQADGDNLGETIKALQNNADFSKLSGDLLEFSKKSAELIKEYDAVPVYAGGDDLLFFAPVSNGEKNVFTLIEELSKLFNEKVKNLKNKPTISFGVSISYYKYPLYEALQAALSMLFDKAKLFKGKNCLAIRLMKHSGQSLEIMLGKETEEYDKFLKLVCEDIEKADNILSSLAYSLARNKIILNEIAADKKKLHNFFINNFNEKVHVVKEGELKPYLQFVEDLTHLIYTSDKYIKEEGKDKDKDKPDRNHILCSILRLNKFMRD